MVIIASLQEQWLVAMQNHVSKSQFKARALEMLRTVETTGEPLVITDHGRPSVEVRPFRAAQEDALVRLKCSVVSYSNPTDSVGEDDWEVMK
jgi:prevent-host-death family protein